MVSLKPAKYADDSLLWALDVGNLSCTNCNSTKLLLTKNSPIQQKIIAIARLQGCINARDTLIVKNKGTIKLTKLKDTTICYGQTITLPTLAQGGNTTAYNYIWLFGKDTIKNPNIAPTVSATYKLKLTDNCSKDSLGINIVDSILYKINVLPKLSISKIPDSTICNGISLPIAFHLKGGIKKNYTLKFQNIATTDTIFNLKPDTTSRYQMVLADGCSISDNVAFTLFVKTDSIYIINSKLNDTVCNKPAYNLIVNAFSKYNLPLNYTVFNQKDSLMATNSDGNFNVPIYFGNNTFKAKIESVCSIQDSAVFYIQANKAMAANVRQTPICFKDTASIFTTISYGNANRYNLKWALLNGQSISSDSIFKFSTKNKKTTLYYTLTDNCSAPLKDSLILLPVALAKLDVNKNVQCLKNNLFIVKNSNDTTLNITNQQLNLPLNNWQKINTITYQKAFIDTGIFYIKLVVSSNNNNCKDSATQTIQILPPPNIKISWQRTTNNFDNSTWRFTASTNQPIQKYIWQIDNFTNQEGNPIFKDYSQTGLVKIKVNAIDYYGCATEFTDSFDMLHRMKFFVPNAVSLNRDGINDAFYIPGADYVKEFNLKIYNRWGSLVFKTNNPSEAWIPSDVSNNLYIYTLNIFDIYNERHELKGVIEVVQ